MVTTPSTTEGTPLEGVHVVSIAVNLPGPAAAARLRDLGARVTTVLPPGGDPMEGFQPDWYADLHLGMDLVTVNLKTEEGRGELDRLLAQADVLLTSHRPSALGRLGLDFSSMHARHPHLCQVDIVGHDGADAELAGHDLTYQAVAGTVLPPRLPAALFVDLAGAERAVGDTCAALIARARTGAGVHRVVVLADVADSLAQPAIRGITAPGGLLGGGFPAYGVYPAREGHVALAALEPHFLKRTQDALGVECTEAELTRVFAERTASDWESWAREHDIPLAAVHTP